MKRVKSKVTERIGWLEKVTTLNGFHYVYPGQALFERYIEDGRKEVIQLENLMPKRSSGGYEAQHIEITIKVKPSRYTK